jgi:hypothetical protein
MQPCAPLTPQFPETGTAADAACLRTRLRADVVYGIKGNIRKRP